MLIGNFGATRCPAESDVTFICFLYYGAICYSSGSTPDEQKGGFVHFSNAGASGNSAAAAGEGDDV